MLKTNSDWKFKIAYHAGSSTSIHQYQPERNRLETTNNSIYFTNLSEITRHSAHFIVIYRNKIRHWQENLGAVSI